MKTHEKSTKMLVKPPSRTFSDPRSQWKAARLATMPTSIKHGLKMDVWWILGYSSPAFKWVWRKGVSKSSGQSSFFPKKNGHLETKKKTNPPFSGPQILGNQAMPLSGLLAKGELPVQLQPRFDWFTLRKLVPEICIPSKRSTINPVTCWFNQWLVGFSFMPFTSSINPTVVVPFTP